MSCVPARSCKALLAEATDRWPNRSRASDGICPSAAHTKASPTSDHERGNAVDLTNDPAGGCDAHALARELVARRDPRISYVVSDRQIANSASVSGQPPWTWRYYGGANPHTSHMHVSIKSTARDDTSPWFAPAPPPEEDDDLLDSDRAMLKAIAEEVGKLAVVVRDPTIGVGTDVDSLVAAVGRLEVVIRDPTSGLSQRLAEVSSKLDALLAKHDGPDYPA